MQESPDGTLAKLPSIPAINRMQGGRVFLEGVKEALRHRSQVIPKIFISYAWEPASKPKDRTWLQHQLRTLHADLEAAGFQVFLDLKRMNGHLEETMATELSVSHIIMPICTPYFASRIANHPNSNVAFEYGKILERGKSGAKIVPICIGKMNESVPKGLFKHLVYKLCDSSDPTDPDIFYLNQLTGLDNPLGILPVACEMYQPGEGLEQYKALLEAFRSHEDIAQIAKRLLREKYRGYSTIQALYGPAFPMKDSYVNLQMIYEAKVIKSEPIKEESEKIEASGGEEAASATAKETGIRDERLSSFEDLFGEKRSMLSGDVFKPAKDIFKYDERKNKKENKIELKNEDMNKAPNFVLVQGRAGIGKTTFVRYSSYEWSEGRLWTDYEWLFVLTLRELRNLKAHPGQQYALWEWIYQSCFAGKLISKEQFGQLWVSRLEERIKAGKILMILDGYDEVPEEHSCQSAFDDLLMGDYKDLPKLITSRPHGVSNLPKEKRDLEVVGFTNENISKYTELYFNHPSISQPKKPTLLVSQLKKNPSLWGISHIPVTLNLLCGLYEGIQLEESEQFAELNSMSGLYHAIEEQLLLRAANKEQAFTKRIVGRDRQLMEAKKRFQVHQAFLSELAFEGMKHEQIILPGQLINELLDRYHIPAEETGMFLQTLKEIGFVKPVIEDEGSKQETESLEFLHLTFQEYFAARHIVRITGSSDREAREQIASYVQKELLNPRYQILFWLVMGLLKLERDPNQLAGLVSVLQSPSTQDVVGDYQAGLLVRCVEETLSDETKPILAPLLAQIEQRLKWTYRVYRQQSHQIGQEAAKEFIDQSEYIQMLKISPGVQAHMVHQKQMWHQVMSDLSKDRKYLAINFMGEIRAVNDQFIQQLLNFLGDKHNSVRWAACEALGQTPESAWTPEVVRGLLGAALKDKDGDVGRAACQALGQMPESAWTPEVIVGLLSTMEDTDLKVRRAACEVLGQIPESAWTPEVVLGLLSALKDYDVRRAAQEANDVRWAAQEALGQMPESAWTPEVVLSLLSALKDTGEEVRRAACEALGQIPEPAWTPEVATGLLSALKDMQWNVRRAACEALGQIPESAWTPEVVTRLLISLKNDVRNVRRAACQALGQIPESALTREVLRGLLIAMKDTDVDVRSAACQALGQIPESAWTSKVVTDLLNAMTDTNAMMNTDVEVRRVACQALGQMPESALTREVLRGLLIAMKDKYVDVRSAACQALGQMPESAWTPEVVRGLLIAMKDTYVDVRSAACQALGQMPESAWTPEVVRGLLSALKDKDGDVRRAACQALGQIPESARTPEVVTGLLNVMKDEDGDRRAACEALGQIPEPAWTPEVVTRLLISLNDMQWHVRSAAYQALGQMPESAWTPEVVQVLLIKMSGEDYLVNTAACHAFSWRSMAGQLDRICGLKGMLEPEILYHQLFTIAYSAIMQKVSLSVSYQMDHPLNTDPQNTIPKNECFYFLTGYVDRHRVEYRITPKLAQLLRRMLPKFNKLLSEKGLSVEMFKQFVSVCHKLPRVEKDPVMMELNQMNTQTNGGHADANNNASASALLTYPGVHFRPPRVKSTGQLDMSGQANRCSIS